MHTDLHKYINNIINSKNYNHFIVHGPHGSGKKHLFKKALNIKKCYNYEQDKLQYKKCDSNYFFDSYYINKYKKGFIKFIKEICDSDFDYKKHIFITNSEFVQSQILDFLRKFMEMNCEYNKFIFICCSIRGPIGAIHSRCLFIRVPFPSPEEYLIFAKQQCKIAGVKFNPLFLKDKNIQKLQDIILLESIGADYNDNIATFCEDIMINIDDYPKIQELVKEIVKNGFDCREIMKTFADHLCRQDVYKLVTEYDYKLALGYRELIHMEALFYNIHLLLK